MPIQMAEPMRRAGRLKILGAMRRERDPGFPEIPTLFEQGAKDFGIDMADPVKFYVLGTPRMPSALVQKYRMAIAAALNDAAVKENLTNRGLTLKWGTPAKVLAMERSESALWTRVVRNSNIKPE
jgi:tripartite-type tricarboxylate transporter receptor subunit TctC